MIVASAFDYIQVSKSSLALSKLNWGGGGH